MIRITNGDLVRVDYRCRDGSTRVISYLLEQSEQALQVVKCDYEYRRIDLYTKSLACGAIERAEEMRQAKRKRTIVEWVSDLFCMGK
jgi:hypothetical protein